MDRPLITVIIPVFNEEKYIDRCVGSILSQTYTELEIILVDGGSVDSSPAICDRYAAANSEKGISVKVLHTENRGVSFSRNRGIDMASGEMILFIDCDDWLEADAIERMAAPMADGTCDMSGCSFISVYGEEPVTGRDMSAECETIMAAHFLSTNVLQGDVHCWGRLYRTELMGQCRFREGLTIGEDMLFLIEYVRKCRRVAVLNYQGYNYFRNPAGAMFRKFTPAAMDQVICWQEVEKLLGTTDGLRKNMLISVMLTAGRIAVLDTAEWDKYGEQISRLHELVKTYKTRSAMGLLDFGYRLKVSLFGISPGLYLKLYHSHKVG